MQVCIYYWHFRSDSRKSDRQHFNVMSDLPMMFPQLSILSSSSLERWEGGDRSVISSVTRELARLRPSGTFNSIVASLSEIKELFLPVFMPSAVAKSLNNKRIKTKIFYHLVSSAPQVLSKLLSVVIFQKPTWKVKRNKIIISDTSSTRISWVRGTHFPRLVSLSNSALLLSRASL